MQDNANAAALLDAILASDEVLQALVASSLLAPVESAGARSNEPRPPLHTESQVIAVAYETVPSSDFSIGDVVGRGGFGTVHRIRVVPGHTVLDSTCEYVVKKLPTASLTARARERLQWEVAVSRWLAHNPAVHGAVGGVHSRGCNGIVMECADLTLADLAAEFRHRVRRAELTPADCASYATFVLWAYTQVASALRTLHAAGVVHCDVKPSNVLITRPSRAAQGSLPRVSLADFGCARMVPSVAAPTAVDRVYGTQFYIAPESVCLPRSALGRLREATGLRSLTFRPSVSEKTDIYAFGVSLLETLNGGLNAFVDYFASQEDFLAQMQKAVGVVQNSSRTATGRLTDAENEELDDASYTMTLAVACPSALVCLAEDCLVMNAADRPTVSEVQQRLRALLAGGTVTDKSAPFTRDVRISAGRTRQPLRTTAMLTCELAAEVEHAEFARVTKLEQAMAALTAANERYTMSDTDSAAADTGCAASTGNDDEDAQWEAAYRRRAVDVVAHGRQMAALLRQSQALPATHRGEQIFLGPRGGRFVVTAKGSVRYLAKDAVEDSGAVDKRANAPRPTGRQVFSNGSACGREIFTGPGGGEFYYTDRGTKVYLRPGVRTTESPFASPSTRSSAVPPSVDRHATACRAASGPNCFTECGSGKHDGGAGTCTASAPRDASSANATTRSPSCRRGPGEYSSDTSMEWRAACSAASTTIQDSQCTANTRSTALSSTSAGVPTDRVYASSGSANGRQIFSGPRGGQYYVNSNGKKTYIK